MALRAVPCRRRRREQLQRRRAAAARRLLRHREVVHPRVAAASRRLARLVDQQHRAARAAHGDPLQPAADVGGDRAQQRVERVRPVDGALRPLALAPRVRLRLAAHRARAVDHDAARTRSAKVEAERKLVGAGERRQLARWSWHRRRHAWRRCAARCGDARRREGDGGGGEQHRERAAEKGFRRGRPRDHRARASRESESSGSNELVTAPPRITLLVLHEHRPDEARRRRRR